MPAKKDKMDEDFAPKVDAAIAEQTKVAQVKIMSKLCLNINFSQGDLMKRLRTF